MKLNWNFQSGGGLIKSLFCGEGLHSSNYLYTVGEQGDPGGVGLPLFWVKKEKSQKEKSWQGKQNKVWSGTDMYLRMKETRPQQPVT